MTPPMFEPLIEFRAMGKIPRLKRDSIITEKLDGTQASVGIIKVDDSNRDHPDRFSPAVIPVKIGPPENRVEFLVYAQSRRRIIAPEDDNYGFAKWTHSNAQNLVFDLGPGLHFGEWWGCGVQRNYGLDHKIFSLFNVSKWEGQSFYTENMTVVPVLYRGPFDTRVIDRIVADLKEEGSIAAHGFMRPEGIVIYHPQANVLFKVTLEDDEQPKSLSQVRRLAACDVELSA